MKIVAFVFARGNSKGIKNKNLLKFKKTTLLGHAINQAKKINGVKQVFVSSDSKKIINYAKKFKAKTPFLRPKKLSRDNSPEIDAWRHAIKYSLSKVKFKTKLYYFSSDHLPIKKSFRFEFMFENSIKKKPRYSFHSSQIIEKPIF